MTSLPNSQIGRTEKRVTVYYEVIIAAFAFSNDYIAILEFVEAKVAELHKAFRCELHTNFQSPDPNPTGLCGLSIEETIRNLFEHYSGIIVLDASNTKIRYCEASS